MKKLIKIVLTAVIIFGITAISYGQTLGIKAVVNLSNQLIKDNDRTYSDDNKINLGFHVGPTVEFSLNNVFSVETGLLISTKVFNVHIV